MLKIEFNSRPENFSGLDLRSLSSARKPAKLISNAEGREIAAPSYGGSSVVSELQRLRARHRQSHGRWPRDLDSANLMEIMGRHLGCTHRQCLNMLSF